ncbi:hypothetical protein LEMLEM_LOCUS11548 [Lemmus lemmus]
MTLQNLLSSSLLLQMEKTGAPTGSVPGTRALIFLSPLEASKPQQSYWPCPPQN